MYLSQVIETTEELLLPRKNTSKKDIVSVGKLSWRKSAETEIEGFHIYRLNEGIFNLQDDDEVSPEQATSILHLVSIIHEMTLGTKESRVRNPKLYELFYFDYICLLGTLQNQVFFKPTQILKIQALLADAVCAINQGKSAEIRETIERRLRIKEKEKVAIPKEYEELANAVTTLLSFKGSKVETTPPAKNSSPKKESSNSAQKKQRDEDQTDSKKSNGRRGKGKGKSYGGYGGYDSYGYGSYGGYSSYGSRRR